MVFIILTNVFSVLSPWLVREAFDHSFSDVSLFSFIKGSDLANDFTTSIVKLAIFYGGLILLVTVIRGYFMFLMRQTVIVVSRKIEYDLKNEIFAHYQKMNLAFFRANFTGDLMNRLSEDVSKVRMYLGPAIMYFVNLVFTFIVVIAMMIAVNPMLTFYVLLPLPVLSFSIFYVSKIINRKSDKIQSQLSDITSFVQESMSGIRILKAFSVQHHFSRVFAKESDTYRDLNMSLTKVNAIFMPLMLFLVGLSTLLTIYIGGIYVVKGTFTYGNIAEFVIYINMLTWPVASLGWVTAIVQSAEASQARINSFLNVVPEIETEKGRIASFQHSLKVEGLSFGYTPDKRVLNRVSFEIKKGQTVGVVGPTGSGKTTLLNLLSRFYDPLEGDVFIDENNLKELQLRSYRNLVSYVPQEVFLFSETIADNIRFGSVDPASISEEQLVRVAKIACVHDSIAAFPMGYQTILGERGITLSGGQKQRIALARALLRDPEIILLDDCLSAVDQTTEKAILYQLKTELNNKTAFVVSHRLSVLADADLLLVLENGTITAMGTHAELLTLNQYYAKLYKKQLEETTP